MRRRHRQHVNPLKQTSLIVRDPLDIEPGPAVEAELGCGDGLFLVQRAQQFPDKLFIGLDIRPEFLEPGVERIAELKLPNVRLELCNLIVDSAHLFPQGRISAFWINFPDPWFKRRQHNRRWLSTESLDHLVRALQPGGHLYYQSDVWDPTLEALGLFEVHPQLENVEGEFTFARSALCEQTTSRQRSCADEGKQTWRLHFVHRSPAA